MARVDQYLEKILQRSFLSKCEKKEWVEEMKAHFQTSISKLEQQGYSLDRAIELAIQRFGEESDLRKKITKSMFGISHRSILALGTLSACLFLGSSLFLCFQSFTFVSRPFLSPWTFLSPSIWLTCLIGTVSLVMTRKRMDRIALAMAALPFLAEYLLMHLSRENFFIIQRPILSGIHFRNFWTVGFRSIYMGMFIVECIRMQKFDTYQLFPFSSP